jgi:hypothetical protein
MLMKYKALVGFSGLVSMKKGEVKEIKDKHIVDDLLKAGYIEPIEKPKATTKKTS